MDLIQRQIKRAHRRLTTQLFLKHLTIAIVIALAIALIGIVVPKLWYVSVEKETWVASWIGSCLGAAFLFAALMTWLRRPPRLTAAVEVDRRFGLKERLSSALNLNSQDVASPVGSALLQDATQRAERIDVRDKFSWGFSRQQLWILIPASLAIGAWFIPDAEKRLPKQSIAANVQLNQIKNATQPLVEQIRKKREEAEKAGLEDAVEMYKQVESELDKLQKDGKLDAKKALAKLNDLKKEMQERRNELGTGESLKKNLEGLKNFDKGPAEKFADSLEEGNFEQASEELEKMIEKLEKGEMTPEMKEQLAKQAESLEKALEDAVANHEKNKKDLEEQISKAEQSGDVQKAAQLRKDLEKMQSKDSQMGELGEMADELDKLESALKSGDAKAAKEALEELKSQVEKMELSKEESEELEEMMDELDSSKSSMNCKKCGGKGCKDCKGAGTKKGGQGRGQGNGDGMGEGQGFGDRPEDETDTNFFDSQVRADVKEGETIFAGKIDGSNKKGITKEAMKEAVLTSQADDAESLENVVLPKAQRDQTREYFDKMRGDPK